MDVANQNHKTSQEPKSATLYRMVMASHTCPYGLKAKDLLERNGFDVHDRHLTSEAKTDAFRAEHEVATTPQIWIGKQHIGGYNDLRGHFGQEVKAQDQTSYQPVIAIFAVASLVAVAVSWYALGSVLSVRTFEWFIAFSMCFLAVQKLQDVESFSTMFLNYDLLAKRWVRYGYLYPFGEAIAGVLMISGSLVWISSPIALFIGSIGAVSVFKAVYVEKRELKCACAGGNSNVPLGFVSLTENLMMIAMGTWMLLR